MNPREIATRHALGIVSVGIMATIAAMGFAGAIVIPEHPHNQDTLRTMRELGYAGAVGAGLLAAPYGLVAWRDHGRNPPEAEQTAEPQRTVRLSEETWRRLERFRRDDEDDDSALARAMEDTQPEQRECGNQ